jgi:glycosyltransferase involved in cell wall biosynthesis
VYDRRIIERLRASGWFIEICEVADEAATGSRRRYDALAGIPDDSFVVVDGLALRDRPEPFYAHSARLRLVALVHLPQGCDPTLAPEERPGVAATESALLQRFAMVIVTGRVSLAAIVRYGATANRVVLVEPGADPAPIATGSADDAVNVLCVATVSATKGHERLIQALTRIRHLPWHLTCAGSLTRDIETARRVSQMIAAEGLEDRVTLTGELKEAALDRCYGAADVFALATQFETYGMAVAEALAHGVPVVSTRTGAIEELIGTQAGIVVEPGDDSAFGGALHTVIGDSEFRHGLRAGAIRARARLRTWDAAALEFAAVLTRVPARV